MLIRFMLWNHLYIVEGFFLFPFFKNNIIKKIYFLKYHNFKNIFKFVTLCTDKDAYKF